MKEIQLTQGKVAVVDDADFEELSKYKWHVTEGAGIFYAARRPYIPGGKPRPTIMMHRQILGLKEGDSVLVDHRNHDGLDNRHENLRVCTNAENTRNQRVQTRKKTSKWKGVSWHKKSEKWLVIIKVNGMKEYVGVYAIEEDAARAYDEAAKQYHGEFACLNFPV